MRGSSISAVKRRASGLLTISYVGAGAFGPAAAGLDASLAYPTGLAAGDLLWVPCANSSNTTFATNALSGFTRKFNQITGGSTSPTIAGFYKIATGSESGTVTLTNPSAGSESGRIYAYRNVDQTTPFDQAEVFFVNGSSAVNYVVPDETPTVAGCVALLHAACNVATGSYTEPAGYTELNDQAGTATNVAFHAHKLALPATATGTRTIVRSATVRGVASGSLLRPAAA